MHTHQSDESTTDTTTTETTPSDPLLAMVHQSIHTSDDDASDISNVLSVKRPHQIQVCQRYLFQHANHTNQQLVDCGANGGLVGSDMHVIHKIQRKINIQGIDNHEVTGLDVVTAGTLINISQGKVIGIFIEYAYLGKESSIHSSGQIATYVASCLSSVGDMAHVLEGRVAVTGFTSTVPPPQHCRESRMGGREVTNKLRTHASAVACAFLVCSSWVFLRLGAVPSFSPIATAMA